MENNIELTLLNFNQAALLFMAIVILAIAAVALGDWMKEKRDNRREL